MNLHRIYYVNIFKTLSKSSHIVSDFCIFGARYIEFYFLFDPTTLLCKNYLICNSLKHFDSKTCKRNYHNLVTWRHGHIVFLLLIHMLMWILDISRINLQSAVLVSRNVNVYLINGELSSDIELQLKSPMLWQ